MECFFKTADMTGQDIQLRQPHGTYQSYWWGMCNAHVDYIKLIRRDPEDIKREAEEKAKMDRKGVIVDRDGFSYFWWWGENDIDCIRQELINLSYDNVYALNWCIGSAMHTNTPHPMAELRTKGGDRLGDKRAAKIFQYYR